jgi:3-methyladenine DNA glycosylase AlkD
MTAVLTAAAFAERLSALADPERRARMERSFRHGAGTRLLGAQMGAVFALAKAHVEMPLGELERMLDSDVHEMRVGALSIMAKVAAARRTTPDQVAALAGLYLRRHDRIDNWDLVDLAAHHVVGRHLTDRPRDVLYELSRSEDVWRRRTAIYSTLHFIRSGDVHDAFTLAEAFLGEPHDLQQQITGGILREAGKHDPIRLEAFLTRHAASMPRRMLRAAIERMAPEERARHLAAAAGQVEAR